MFRKRRRPIITRRPIRGGSRKIRIRIPQTPDRVIRLMSRDAVRREMLREDPWWFVIHQRGVRRPTIGIDPREARAVPKSQVRGTLPERIVYKAFLQANLGGQFDFQSSLQGGRLELGGIVADFLFENWRIVVRVQGPTHAEHRRFRKDEEQRLILEEMGYRVLDLDLDVVYNEARLWEWIRRFLISGPSGRSSGIYTSSILGDEDFSEEPAEEMLRLGQLADQLWQR